MAAEGLRLPRNRWQLLWDVVKNHWRTLLGGSALLLALALPLLAGCFFAEYARGLALDGRSGAQAMETCLAWNAVELGMTLVLSVPVSAGAAGLARVLQRLVWQEGALFRPDFAAGVKENWTRFLLSGEALCLAAFSARFCADLAAYAAMDAGTMILAGLSGAAAFVLTAGAVYMAALPLQYDLTVARSVRNALLLTAGCFPQSCALAAVTALPALLAASAGIAGRLVYVGVMGLFGAAFTLLCLLLLCNGVFDRAINASRYPERVDRGLFREDGS